MFVQGINPHSGTYRFIIALMVQYWSVSMKSRFCILLLITVLLTGCKQSSVLTNTIEPSRAPTQVATTTQDALVATRVAATLTAQAAPPTPTSLATTTVTPQPSSTATATATATPTSTGTGTPAATQTPSPTPSPTPVKSAATGKVCYLVGQAIPAMTAYFQNSATGAVAELTIATGQITYTATLTPGTYIAYAWLPDFSFGGLYSNAVPCGLKASCDDHAARPFTVQAGKVTKGIDLCDWYTGPFEIPYPPGQEPTTTVGSIEGSIFYPGGNPPALKVVAFNVKTKYWYWVGTVSGGTYFTLADLPPGTYHVVAYADNGQAGGYADSAHNLINIVVKAGQTVIVEINDWEGSFPSNPVK
jgi:uncharacterized protein YceK